MVFVDELFNSALIFFFINKVLLKLNQPLVSIGKMEFLDELGVMDFTMQKLRLKNFY